jgi:hypothetical protein
VELGRAARAHLRVTGSLTCDLGGASVLTLAGKPKRIEKRLEGVARLEQK